MTEMEQVTGMHRKRLVRRLHAPSLERQPRTRQRGVTYGVEVERVVVTVWASLDFLCAERLTPTLLTTARHLARFGVVTLTDAIAAQLGQISEASVTRLLARRRTLTTQEQCHGINFPLNHEDPAAPHSAQPRAMLLYCWGMAAPRVGMPNGHVAPCPQTLRSGYAHGATAIYQ